MPKEPPPHDPLFLAVVAAIEKKIGEGDRIARANDIALTDAEIIAALRKAAQAARGKAMAQDRETLPPRKQILSALGEQLHLLRGSIFEQKTDAAGREIETLFPTVQWIAALKVVEKAVGHGTGKLRGSRGFLDSLSLFLAQDHAARSQPQSSK